MDAILPVKVNRV